jgi:4-methyl-5(b-hydroxyethyl)-thiazole monophosphate biosynthesis
MERILIPLADGCEEMEAVIATDVLRRAEFEVITAGLRPGLVTASRGVVLAPDTVWEEINPQDFDVLLLPGGLGGTQALCAHAGVQQALKTRHAAQQWIAALCAAPLALYQAGILPGPQFTCYPGVEQQMAGAERSPQPVVTDGHLITSQGPGTAFEFALRIVAELQSPAAAAEVRAGLLLN